MTNPKRPILTGYMALYEWAEDYSHWDGEITGPTNPQGANRFWEDPIVMIEKRAYDRLHKALGKIRAHGWDSESASRAAVLFQKIASEALDSAEDSTCWACRGYGRFSSWGKPSRDPSDRACLECGGSGQASDVCAHDWAKWKRSKQPFGWGDVEYFERCDQCGAEREMAASEVPTQLPTHVCSKVPPDDLSIVSGAVKECPYCGESFKTSKDSK